MRGAIVCGRIVRVWKKTPQISPASRGERRGFPMVDNRVSAGHCARLAKRGRGAIRAVPLTRATFGVARVGIPRRELQRNHRLPGALPSEGHGGGEAGWKRKAWLGNVGLLGGRFAKGRAKGRGNVRIGKSRPARVCLFKTSGV